MGSNGHNHSDLRLDHIQSRIVMLDGTIFSGHRLPSTGRKGSSRADGRRVETSDAVEESVDFGAFPDGTLIDLVRGASDMQPRLLIWKNAEATIRADFRCGDRQFVPPRLDPGLMRAVRLPTAIATHANVGDLVQKLQECISTYIDLQPQFVRLVSNFILSTWLADRSTVAPYLWVTGPYSGGKTTLLRLLHCLCRRPVLSSDISGASLYLLPSAVMPTLLIDEFESDPHARQRDVLRLLRGGSTRGGHVFRGGKPYEVFGPKVIASRQGPTDAALASRALVISMLPTRRSLPELSVVTQDKIADQFQGQLLAYRLRNYWRISTTTVQEFTPRMRDLVRVLAAPLLGHEKLTEQLISDLQPHDEEAESARHGEPEFAVATALYDESHRTRGILTVGTLASSVNDLLARIGETYRLKPRAVGNYLRTFGLQTRTLGNLGRGLRMTRDLKIQVHQLARTLGIRKADIVDYQAVEAGYAGMPCRLCDEYGLLVQEDGITKLRTVDPFQSLRTKRRPSSTLYER